MKDIAIEAWVQCSTRSMGRSVAENLPLLQPFFRSCVVQMLSDGDGPTTRYTLRRDTESIMMICLFFSFVPVSFHHS